MQCNSMVQCRYDLRFLIHDRSKESTEEPSDNNIVMTLIGHEKYFCFSSRVLLFTRSVDQSTLQLNFQLQIRRKYDRLVSIVNFLHLNFPLLNRSRSLLHDILLFHSTFYISSWTMSLKHILKHCVHRWSLQRQVLIRLYAFTYENHKLCSIHDS